MDNEGARKMFTVGLVKYRRCKHQDQGLVIDTRSP